MLRIIKAVVAVVLLGVSGYLMFRPKPTLADLSFYYDLSEARLYVAGAGNASPLRGVGGEPDDAYKAVVYVCADTPNDRTGERRVAYLIRYSPELTDAFRTADRARAAGEPVPADLLPKSFVAEQTFVRRPGDAEWFSVASDEGAAIQSAFMSSCPDGAYAVVCSPID